MLPFFSGQGGSGVGGAAAVLPTDTAAAVAAAAAAAALCRLAIDALCVNYSLVTRPPMFLHCHQFHRFLLN